ncbi:hypothetical protein Q8A67_022438 [Cirrhinus molitorella]|uniref:Uncharacterized protein n=1 Tax=Cirrhinus molitorella TaxID=172907 RepID=A0AA88P1R8_9TELE|nr:hypothetical protein Q8A67_022438 [Cirrhinus molitorella]
MRITHERRHRLCSGVHSLALISVAPRSPTRSVMKSVHIWSLRSASEQQGEGQPLRSLRPQSPSAIGQRAPASLFQSHGCVRHSLSERMREMHAELRVYRYGRDLLLKPRELTAHA